MQYEVKIRLISFVVVYLGVALWEILSPQRQLSDSKPRRWLHNLGIILLDNLVLRLLFPGVVIAVAVAAEQSNWGLLNYFHVPTFIAIIVGVLVLDLIIYLQHLMFHAVPLFWRLHMVHHTDLDIDVSTGLRFHPLEILVSLGIKLAAVAALGSPVIAVLIFEVLLNGTSLFNHGNIRLTEKMDCFLRRFLVTPDMHRVHHSVIIRETNSNFGFNLSWWDRLFGTYRSQPAAGHKQMTIGLSTYRNAHELTLPMLLKLPFSGNPGRYSFDHIGREPAAEK
jgi:sterol desaturase/sphingolipid hydroxylase (fatty acid hydroxylase superfamily)